MGKNSQAKFLQTPVRIDSQKMYLLSPYYVLCTILTLEIKCPKTHSHCFQGPFSLEGEIEKETENKVSLHEVKLECKGER